MDFVLKAFFHHKEHKVEATENTKISKSGLLVAGQFEIACRSNGFLSELCVPRPASSAWKKPEQYSTLRAQRFLQRPERRIQIQTDPLPAFSNC